MINNRQNGRRRGRGGGNNGGGNQRQGNQGRGDSGNRIDSRARGNASQLYEKYKNLARDAQMSGDRVNIEYYLQYADHYFRVLADTRSRFEDNSQPRRQQPFDIDGFDDEETEGEPIRAGEQNGDVQHDDRQQDDRQQNDRQQGNHRRDRGERGDRGDHDQPRNARDGGENGDGRGERHQRPRRDREQRGGEEIGGQHRSDPPAAGEPLGQRAEQVLEADAPVPAPRRRGRPRREAAGDTAAADSGVADSGAALAADRLPPSLGIPAANDADDGEEAKPRRRRARSTAAEVPSAAE